VDKMNQAVDAALQETTLRELVVAGAATTMESEP